MPKAEERIQEVRRCMVLAALDAGHAPRDIGLVLDISPQAVGQIKKAWEDEGNAN